MAKSSLDIFLLDTPLCFEQTKERARRRMREEWDELHRETEKKTRKE